MNRKIILLLLLPFFLTCRKDDDGPKIILNDKGEISFLPYLWKIPLHEDGNPGNHLYPVEGNTVFDQDKILLATTKDSQHWDMTLVEGATGTVLWKWNDWFPPGILTFYGRTFLEQNNHLHWITGKDHYWVDLTTGQTVKKYQGVINFTLELVALDNTVFSIGDPVDTLASYNTLVVFRGDFYNEEPERILVPEFNLEHVLFNTIGYVTSVIPFVENQDTFIITTYHDIFPNINYQSYLGLYNLTTKSWVYDKVPLCEIEKKGKVYHAMQKFENTVIMNVGESLVCYNYYTGERVWRYGFLDGFYYAGFGIEDGIVVAGCENNFLYGIDARTGNLIWFTEGAENSSKLENRILNGVVYFAGRSNGFFHAVDIYSGKTLWRLDPFQYAVDNAFWRTSVNIVQGINGKKGKVIVQNALNAYCFEAVK